MFNRPKIYYPKSKVLNNLYTSGKEWMFEDGIEYIGFYHKYLDGNVASEAIYDKAKSKKLIKYISSTLQPDNIVYNKLKNITVKLVKAPVNSVILPVLEDYQAGFFKRHFIYRRNYSSLLNDFFEVDEEQYKSWQTPDEGIDEKLYNGFTIDWKLTGPRHDVVVDGQIKEFGVYDTNRRLAFLYNKMYPNTSKILTDYIEFSIYSKLTSKEIQKQFGA